MNPVILTLLVTAQAELQGALMDHIMGADDDAKTMTRITESLSKLDEAVGVATTALAT